MAGKVKQAGSAPELTPAPLSPAAATPRPRDEAVSVVFAKPWRHNWRDYGIGDHATVSGAEREQLLCAGAIVGTPR